MTFRINRVYTRTGDAGETGLVGGARVSKNDLRVWAYGDVDELNSALGLAKERIDEPIASLRALIEYIQQELFDLGSELATPPESYYEGMWRAGATHEQYLESLCDHFGKHLPELTSFILPGGNELASHLHLCRTICRRAERSIVALYESYRAGEPSHEVSQHCIIYLNRLSDFLFVLARWVLAEAKTDAPLWLKNAQRNKPVIPE